jgi:hypothetical protein
VRRGDENSTGSYTQPGAEGSGNKSWQRNRVPQTDNIPAWAEHVLLRCSDAQTTTNIFFLRALSMENGNETKTTQVTPMFKQSNKRCIKVMEVHLHVYLSLIRVKMRGHLCAEI